MLMKRYWVFVICFCVHFGISQSHTEIAIGVNDFSLFNHIIVLPDDHYLLIINHTSKEYSQTELLKLDYTGDTIFQKELDQEGLTGAAFGIPTEGGFVLCFASTKECYTDVSDFGYVFIEFDINGLEKKRTSFFDPTISRLPVGLVRRYNQKYYCFNDDGMWVFSKTFQYESSFKKPGYFTSCKDVEIMNGNFFCTRGNFEGIEKCDMSGNLLKRITRTSYQEIAQYQGHLYIHTANALLKLDENLNVVDSTTNIPAGVGHLYVFEDQLIASGSHLSTRYELPSLKEIPGNQSYWNDEKAGIYVISNWWGGDVVANNISVARLINQGLTGCSFDILYPKYCVFESTQPYANIYRARPEHVSIDSVWIDTLSRFQDYEEFEFNIDVGVILFNDGEEEVRECELRIYPNLDSGCINPTAYVMNPQQMTLKPGERKMLFYKNLKLSNGVPFTDSLYLTVGAYTITQNKSYLSPGVYANCSYGYVFVRASKIVEREIPKDRVTNKYTIFPNPTYNMINFDGIIPHGAELRIVNVNGKLVYEKHFIEEAVQWQLDVSHLPSALYFLEIRHSDFDELTKFVKL